MLCKHTNFQFVKTWTLYVFRKKEVLSLRLNSLGDI